MYQLLSDLLLLFSASARRLLFPFLVPRSRQEWEMIIKFNEIYIYINRSGETQKVHICFIHSKSHVASHLRRNSSRRLKAFSESAPAPTSPPHSSLHRLLLHVIEIETSVKLGLFLGTKEWHSWIKNPLVVQTFGSHYTHTPFGLKESYQRDAIMFRLVFPHFVNHIPFTCCLALSNVYLTSAVFAPRPSPSVATRTACLRHKRCAAVRPAMLCVFRQVEWHHGGMGGMTLVKAQQLWLCVLSCVCVCVLCLFYGYQLTELDYSGGEGVNFSIILSWSFID